MKINPPKNKDPRCKGAYRRLTQKELKRVAMFTKHTSMSQTCLHFEISLTTVTRAMRLHGLKPNRQAPPRST